MHIILQRLQYVENATREAVFSFNHISAILTVAIADRTNA